MAIEGTEVECNAYLRQHGAFGKAKGVYREMDLERQIHKDILAGIDLEWVEASILPGIRRVTLAEALQEARLTRHQRYIVDLRRRVGSQAKVCRITGESAPAISQCLARAWLKVIHAAQELEARQPDGWAEALWNDEQRYKRRLIYRPHRTRIPGGSVEERHGAKLEHLMTMEAIRRDFAQDSREARLLRRFHAR